MNWTEDRLEGKYNWKGIYGVGASIDLKKNGIFEYNWVSGLLNGTTVGTWKIEGRKIRLNSNIQPSADFDIIKAEHDDTNALSVKVSDINDNPIYFANCFLLSNNKVIESAATDLAGVAQLPKIKADSLKIQFVGYKNIKLKYDQTASIYHFKMKEISHYRFFTDHELTCKRNRLYDPELEGIKNVKKYYEK